MTQGQKMAALGLGAALVLGIAGKANAAGHYHGSSAHAAGTSKAAARAIAYARHQLGKPYCWAGTGQCPNPPYTGYDCSGLVMEAWAHAGVSIPRTAAGQYAGLHHVRHPEPGDLVFAPGADGTWASPGHVALVISGGRVIQAYSTGVPIEVSTLSQFSAGSGGIIGYARPGGA
jgi:cell wall-associated NlpC family hydrolase